MKYAVVIEKGGSNDSAYVPDLVDCVGTGATRLLPHIVHPYDTTRRS